MGFSERPCRDCGVMVIDVRDADTWATYPVEAQATAHPGFILYPDENPKKNPYAHRAEAHLPHLPLCVGTPVDGEGQEEGEPGEVGCSVCVGECEGHVGRQDETSGEDAPKGKELDLGPTNGKPAH